MRGRISVDEPVTQFVPQAPQLAVGHAVDRGPGRAVGDRLRTDLALGDAEDLAGHPRRRMNPVGDRGDRHFRRVEARPQRGEHFSTDLAVQPGHAVGALAEPEAHVCHVENVGVLFPPEIEDPLERNTRDAGEVGGDERAREPVDAGRDRGMGRENRSGPNGLPGLVKTELVGLEEFPDALYAEESGVALVGVKDLRRGRPSRRAVRADRANAAHAQQQFLLEPVVGTAAVQPVRDLPGGRVVLLDVAIEKEERHAPDLGHEDLRVQRPAFRER